MPSITKLVISEKPPWLTNGSVIPVIGKARARKLCDAVWNIEKLTDARKLRPLLQA